MFPLASGPVAWTSVIDDTGEAMACGEGAPRWLLIIAIVLIPKSEYAEDVDKVLRQPASLRMLTLMNTAANIIARQADEAFGQIAATSVASPQRGFIQERVRDDNIFELDGSLQEFRRCGDRAGFLLLGFAAAFPGLSRMFVFAVLRKMNIPHTLYALVAALYDDLHTDVLIGGVRVASRRLASGIKQGCPISGSIFALCLDPLVRCYMAERTFR